MARITTVLLALFIASGCYGSFHMEDGGLSSDETAAAPAAATADTRADTTATTTPAPETTPTQPTPEPTEPVVEETEPDPEPAPEPAPEEPAIPELGSIVEFQIAQGTGNGAWNTPDTPVTVYVGQVLKITNFDDQNHRMHAANSAGVPHGGDLQPGQSEEYVVSSEMTIGSEALLWEHNVGRSAPFWVEALPYPNN